MVKSPQDPFLLPGTWNLWKTGKHLLLFSCLRCGEVFVLLHRIKDNGVVSEIVRCTRKGCAWQDDVKLEGWIPLPAEEDPGVV